MGSYTYLMKPAGKIRPFPYYMINPTFGGGWIKFIVGKGWGGGHESTLSDYPQILEFCMRAMVIKRTL